MKIHEYQGKAIFRDFGVPIPEGYPAFSVDEAEEAARKIGGRVVVKAQIHAGGRGKGGGVKLADSPDELREITREMLGKRIIDHNLDEIADDFIAFVREQWLEFWRQ